MSYDIQEFKVGEIVPASGVYEAIHDSLDGDEHAHAHQVIAIAGTAFLPCRACKNLVTFRLRGAFEQLERHHHFESQP